MSGGVIDPPHHTARRGQSGCPLASHGATRAGAHPRDWWRMQGVALLYVGNLIIDQVVAQRAVATPDSGPALFGKLPANGDCAVVAF
jgi:hypothetical protein